MSKTLKKKKIYRLVLDFTFFSFFRLIKGGNFDHSWVQTAFLRKKLKSKIKIRTTTTK